MMKIDWQDGADHYGPAIARVLDGVYAEVESVVISSVNPRTGPRHFRLNSAGQNNAGLRRVLSTPRDNLSLCYAFSLSALPTDTTAMCLVSARNMANKNIFSIVVGPTGDLYIKNGGQGGAVIAHNPMPVVVTNAYQHFEVRYDQNGITVWLNDVQALQTHVLPSGIEGGNIVTAVKIGQTGYPHTGSAFIVWDIDDIACGYTDPGDINVRIGDGKCIMSLPNADVGTQDMVPSIAGDAYKMIDNVPPVDATEYIKADGQTVPQRSDFGLQTLPVEVVEVLAVSVYARMVKLDAGTCKAQVGLVSGSVTEYCPEFAVSMAPVWYHRTFNANPATGLAWDVTSANLAQVTLNRTA